MSILSSSFPYQSQIQTDITTFQSQNQTLKQFTKQISQIQVSLIQHRQTAFNNKKALLQQIETITNELAKADNAMKVFKNKHMQEKQDILRLKTEYNFTKKKRWAIAETINLKAICELKMEDRKSEAHEVFKWVISVIYKEPSSKYYWENFKEQAYSNDKGHDFKERMGKMSASDMKQDEKVHTQKFIQMRDNLIGHMDFDKPGIKEEITKIFNIATLILEGAELSKKSKELDAIDNKIKDEQILKLDAIQKLNNKSAAIKQRIEMNQQYQFVLLKLEKHLNDKNSIYNEIISEGSKIINDMKDNKVSVSTIGTSIGTNVQKPATPAVSQKGDGEKDKVGGQPKIPYNREVERTEACTCLLF